MTKEIFLADGILVLHTIVVGITVAGFFALFFGRFSKFHRKDIFAWSFIICSSGQLFSFLFTGACVLTTWEKQLRQKVNPSVSLSNSFIKDYLPFLPEDFIDATPLLTLVALVVACIQIYFSYKKRRNS